MKFAASFIFVASLSASLSLSACAADTTSTQETAPMMMTSTQSFAVTEARLREGFDTRGLKLFTVVDHGAGAQSVGEDIGQSKLFIFGNPKAGTPLMQAEPKLGLELPMKILLRDAGGSVQLYRTDIAATVRAYGVTDQDARLGKISETLDDIMSEAAGN